MLLVEDDDRSGVVVLLAPEGVGRWSSQSEASRGKRVVGLGGEITGGLGEAVVDDYTPSAALTSVTVTGREAVDNDGPYGGNWSVRAYAVCATP